MPFIELPLSRPEKFGDEILQIHHPDRFPFPHHDNLPQFFHDEHLGNLYRRGFFVNSDVIAAHQVGQLGLAVVAEHFGKRLKNGGSESGRSSTEDDPAD